MTQPLILDYASGDRREWPGEAWARWWARAWYVLAGILLPAGCWMTSYIQITKPEWQSGHWGDYAALLLMGQVAWPLFPLMLYSMACLGLAVISRQRLACYLVVRLGVYAGVLQGLVFSVIMVATMDSGGDSGAVSLISAVSDGGILVAAIVVVALWWLIRRFGWVVAAVLGGVLLLGVLVTAAMTMVSSKAMAPVGILAFGALGGGAFATTLAYATMSFWLLRKPPHAQPAIVGGAIGAALWTGLYAGSWALAVSNAIAAYSRLPATRPSRCYIATAAARGHRRFVRRDPLAPSALPVNHQLRTLKAGEIALATLFPRTHRLCRRLYDRVGPPLARRLTHPLAADAAYLTLKPAEWATWAALACLGVTEIVPTFYRNESARPENLIPPTHAASD